MQDASIRVSVTKHVFARGETNKWFADISIASLCQN